MLKKDWLNLPEELRMFIAVDAESLLDEIVEKFSLSVEQKMYIFDIEDKLFLKQFSPLELPNYLDKMPDSKNFDVRLLTLDIAYKILWPLQDYIGDVDKLILRLGGKVPRIKPLAGQMKEQSRLFPGQAKGTVAEMMDKYEDFKELRLSTNKILDSRGYHLTATVDNWIKDYIHFVGVEGRDSLKRAQYLSKSPNSKNLNPEDKDSLRLLLVSYDDNVPFKFDYRDLKLKVEDIAEEIKKLPEDETGFDLEAKIGDLQFKILELENKMLSPEVILSEASGQLPKVRDVLWNALAMGDKDKVISCLKLLVEKKTFDLMLREDSRFKNILKRFIGLRFGRSAENYLSGNSDPLVARRLFLEMIFSDKLRLDQSEAMLVAFYLTNISVDSGQVVYLDAENGSLKWRSLEATGSNISFLEKL